MESNTIVLFSVLFQFWNVEKALYAQTLYYHPFHDDSCDYGLYK